MKFCLSTNCFYDPKIHDPIPEGAVEVSIAEFKALSVGRNAGMAIVLGKGGKLELVQPEPVALTRKDVEAQRLSAYANTVTGSDRYFAEAQRMQVMGEPGWEDIRAEGVRRFEDIQQQYPWPESEAAADQPTAS